MTSSTTDTTVLVTKPRRGRLIMMCGLPGAGKTTEAGRLESSLDAVRLSPDEWIIDLRGDVYSTPLRDRVELLQWRLAQRLLALGQVVVLENGFWSADERDAYRLRARELGAGVELRYLDAPLGELWRRLDARNRAAPPGAVAVSRSQLDEWSTWFQPPGREELATYDDAPA